MEEHSSAIKFTYQGLYRLCEILPFQEFLKCRLICKRWEIFISCHRRFTRATTRFKNSIFRITSGEGLEVAVDREIYWRKAHLDFFPFSQRSGLRSYWETSGKFCTILYLESLAVSCYDLVAFLNECPSVKEITFDNNGFQPRYPRKNFVDSQRKGKQAIFCVHKTLKKNILPSSASSPFVSVRFSRQNVIPLCLLEYIKLRTQGKLEEFVFQNATCTPSIRQSLHPSKEIVENQLFELIQRNASSLKKLAIVNCRSTANFLDRISQIEKLSLKELCFAPMHFPQAARELDASYGLSLLESQQSKSVHSLQIGFHRPDKTKLQEVLTNYGKTNTLRKLVISVAKGFTDIRPVLALLTNLTDLEVKELMHFKQMDPIRGINPNYLAQLPSSIVSLNITHCIKGDNIPLQNSNLSYLRHLKIDYCDAKDETCQQIIRQFKFLETLHIRNSTFLTDVGVTGMDTKTCTSLWTNINSSFPKIDSTSIGQSTSLSDLKYLRELSFYGCRNITDVSLIYGVKLEKLCILDISRCSSISDLGILYAIANNTNLEHLNLYDAVLTTKSITSMLQLRTQLLKIHLSKESLKRHQEMYEREAVKNQVSLMKEIFTDEYLLDYVKLH